MPTLQEIRQFNEHLTSLGNEPKIVAEWGEDLEEIAAPEGGLDSDISSLLADAGPDGADLTRDLTPGTPEIPGDEEQVADLSELLEEPELEEPPGAELPSPGPSPEELGFGPVTESADEDPFAAIGEITGGEPSGDAPPDEGDFSDFAALLGGDETDSDVEGLEPVDSIDEEAFDVPDAGEAFEEPSFEDEPFAEESAPIGEFDDAPASGDFDVEAFEFPDEGFSFDDQGGADVPAEFGETEELGDAEPVEFAEPTELTEPIEFAETTDLGEPAELEPTDAEPFDEASQPFDEASEPISFDAGDFEFSDEEFDEVPTPATGDDFSFEDPSRPGAATGDDIPFGDFEVGEEGESDVNLEDIDEEIDEFSLGDFGSDFGVNDHEAEEDLNPAATVPEVAPGIPVAPSGFQITDADFAVMKRTLSGMPLNLKVEVEQIIAEALGSPEETEQLVQMLVRGEAAQDIANSAGRILGKTIRIPRGYARRSGVEFEQERQSFAYRFRENVLPVLRMVAVIAVGVALLALAGYHLVFRPLFARSLYRQGLALIVEDQYTLGNQTFERAWDVWKNTRWFYTYAETFVDQRQYSLASEKYEQLLFGMSDVERDRANDLLNNREYLTLITIRDIEKQGVLDYASLESEVLGNYARADRLLQLVLIEDTSDYEARLAMGDNYMLWADDSPERYDDARVAYARLMERYGQTDELLFRMLTYFIRTDNIEEVVKLKDVFQADEKAEIEPPRYAELAGYLLDKGLDSEVEDILFRAVDIDSSIPDIHYHLARYYRRIDAAGEEQLALNTSRRLLESETRLTTTHRGMLVDTLIRIGENHYDRGNYLDAEEILGLAIEQYEEGIRRRLLNPAPVYGRAYSRFGDILYYIGRQYENALEYYLAAEENGFDEPDLDYKQGFVYYRTNQMDQALDQFLEAEEFPSGLTNALLWATANTHYARGNFFAAEAYYRELLDRVERQRGTIRTLLIAEDPAHRSVVEYMIRTTNNLGVTMNRLHAETGDPGKYSEGLVYLSESAELAENYRREPSTLTRSDVVNLAFLNTREILYPRPEYELQIYNDIAEDLDDLEF